MGRKIKTNKSKKISKHNRKKQTLKYIKKQAVLNSRSRSVIVTKNKQGRVRTLKVHMRKTKSLRNRIRISRFLEHLTKLGEEKGEIRDDLFTYDEHSLNILRFIIKKYGGQCDEEHPLQLSIMNKRKREVVPGIKGVKNIIVCLSNLLSKKSKQLISMFTSDSKYDDDDNDYDAHANLLVINIDTREIIRIDPMGVEELNDDDQFHFNQGGIYLADRINKEFGLDSKDESEKYKYINNASMSCPVNLNPQQNLIQSRNVRWFTTRKERKPSEIETGTCQLWSILFSELIIGFPELTYAEILGHLSSYMKNESETVLYLIRGYFWYLKQEVFYDVEEEEKEKEDEDEDDIYQQIIQHNAYLSKLEETGKYSPLVFKKLYDSLQETINHIKTISLTVDARVAKDLYHTISIYEGLVKRYQDIKADIDRDSKRTEEERKLD